MFAVSSCTPAVISINIISGSHSIMGFYSAHLACGTRVFVTLQIWIEQIATLCSLGRQKPALKSAPWTALITQPPIHSRNYSATRKANCSVFYLFIYLFYDPPAAIDSTGYQQGVVTLVQQIEMLVNVKHCRLNDFGRTDLWGKKRAPPSFYIHNNIHSGFAAPGKWGCIECVTGGRDTRPQSWPFQHDWIN